MLARGLFVAGLLGVLGLRFALLRQRDESRLDVDEPHHALFQLLHFGNGGRAAAGDDLPGMALIPIDAVRLDHVVEHPTLLVEALHRRCALGPALRPVVMRGARGRRRAGHIGRGGGFDRGRRGGTGRGGEAGRLQKSTTIHDRSSRALSLPGG